MGTLKSVLPATIKYARILIAIQIVRFIGLALIPGLQSGALPATFVIPATVGDSLTAITAPLVAFALGRGGVKTWGVAIVWNALGLADLLNAVSLGSLTGSTAYLVANDAPILFGVTFAVVLHIITTILLLRKSTIDYVKAR